MLSLPFALSNRSDDDGMSSVGMDGSSAARAKWKGADLNVLAGYSTTCIITKQGDFIVFF